jgi:hypothetical protein
MVTHTDPEPQVFVLLDKKLHPSVDQELFGPFIIAQNNELGPSLWLNRAVLTAQSVRQDQNQNQRPHDRGAD